MAKKIQQFYIIKLKANKIIYNNLDLNINLYTARNNDECVSLGDNQVLRTIRQVTNKEFLEEDLNELLKEKTRLKNKIKKSSDSQDGVQYKKDLFNILREIDNLLFIPELISVVSDKTSEYNKLQKKGFVINGIRYLPFMCSAGNARVNTAFFLSEQIFYTVQGILQNGHNKVEICYEKYNAYYSLTSSATSIVSAPKVCVVPDYELDREFLVDWVSEDMNTSPRVQEGLKTLPFSLWDGMGIISPNQAEKWSKELDLDYIPCGFCVRNAFIKGMVFVFDFHKFAYEIAPTRKITDVWGVVHHIDDVEVILTQSQFKLWNAYSSWQQYTENLTKNDLRWGISKYAPKQEKDSVRTNYQFLQVLNLEDKDIESLCKPTINWLNGIVGKDINYIKLYLLGKLAKFDNVGDIWKNIQDPLIKALLIDDRVGQDKHLANKVLQSINKRIKESYYGKLITNGNFQFMISDPYAFCEYIFGMEVKGLLNKEEHYSNYWNNKNINQIAGLRSPLTWRSEINKLSLIKNEQTEEWYKYLSSGIVLNVFGYDVLKFSGADFDGDLVYTTDNKQIINCCYGGLPVIGEHKKPKKEFINYKQVSKYYSKGFNTKVGYYTNCATATMELLNKFDFESREYKELIQRSKLYCHFQALIIDSTKGIKVEEVPKYWIKATKITQEMRETLSKEQIAEIEFNNSLVIKKRPHFMQHLYSNYAHEYKQYLENYDNYSMNKFGCSINNIPEDIKMTKEYKDFISNFDKYNPLLETNGTMNRVCKYMEQNCKELKNSIKLLKNDNYLGIYSNANIQTDLEKLKQVEIKYLEYLNYKKNKIINEGMNNFSIYLRQLKLEMLEITTDIRELANLVVYVCYKLYPNKPKDFAWDICGEGIVENLFENKNNYEISIPTEDINGDLQYLGKKYSIKTKNLYEEMKEFEL